MKTVEVADAVVQYRRSIALDGVSLSVLDGEYVAVFGEGGSGKTSLLRLIGGRVSASSGTVRVFDRAPRSVSARIGYAAERLSAASLVSASQVLAKSLAAHNVPAYQRSARAGEALELLDLYGDRDRAIRELGHTHLASLAIATAIAHKPAVVLIDNIAAILPFPLARRVWSYLEDRRAVDGLSLIHATTSSDEAERADRVLILDDGRMLATDSPAALRTQHGQDTLVIESADPDSVRRTLRGIYDVVMEETREGLRISLPDAVPAVAHLFRHPSGGFRSVFIRQPTLWDVLENIKAGQSAD